MSVYERGKIWWCEFQIGGQRIRESTGQTSKRKAQEFERRLRTKYADDLYRKRTGAASLKTYGEAVLKWLPTAPKSMHSHIRNTLPYLQDKPLISLPDAVYDMRSDMTSRGLTNQTINRRLACVRRVLNLAYKEWGDDWLDRPLAEKVPLLSEKNTARDITASKKEVFALVDSMTDETAKKVTLLAPFTGLRKSEILALEPEDWKPPYIIVRKSKGGKTRRVPVVSQIHEYVTPPFDISTHRLRVEFESARVAIGRPEFRFHDLRHTFGTWLAEDPEIPLSLIRDLLGHSSLAVTSKYVNLRGGDHAAVEKSLG